MSMTTKQKDEKVQRLEVAYMTIKDTLESQPLAREIHPGSEIATKWGITTAAFSGLEQTIKFLIAEEKSCTIEELINQQSQGAGSNGVNPYRTHDLASLFCRLEDETKFVIRQFYSQFQSLHSNIKIEKLDDFLSEVSGEDGRGYQLWRYTLIEDEELLPCNSTEAMVAIWGICVAISLTRIDDNSSIEMPEEILAKELYAIFLECVAEIESKAMDTGNPIPDLELEANERLFRNGHELNVFAKILQHFGSFKSHGLSNLSELLSRVVDCWQEKVSVIGETERTLFLDWFIRRASGKTPYGESIRWDPESNRFKNIDWSLNLVSSRTLPKSAITIENTNPSYYLQKLKFFANECGYKIRENHSYTNSINSKEVDYFCTLEVCEPDSMESVIAVWQKPKRSRDFSIVVERTQNEIKPPIQNWISLVRRRLKRS